MSRFRRCSLLLVAAVLASLFPSVPALAQPMANVPEAEALLPVPTQLRVPPLIDQRLPSLTTSISVSPEQVVVGETATMTVTVSNQAADVANTVVVTLPTPDGATPLAGPGFISEAEGWRWQTAQLAGGSTITMTATMQLSRMPTGAALVAHVQVNARELVTPVHNVGGAIVIDQAPSPAAKVPAPNAAVPQATPVEQALATAEYVPGNDATLQSPDAKVKVQLPAGVADRELDLQYSRSAAPGEKIPPAIAGFKSGFGPFFLHAKTEQGQDVHQFAKPVVITVSYTPEQLQALGIAEADLTLFWFDEQAGAQQQGMWVPIASTVDPTTRTVSASVDHFSAYQLGDGSSPSAAYIPSLKGWQVGLYTGSANYSMPIEVPSGPGGIKPSLQLSYSSTATDGDSGLRPKQQAGWVGKGWSLDTGAVARQKITIDSSQNKWVDTYTLVFNGQSLTLVQGSALAGNTGEGDTDPTHWEWRPTDESFVRIQVVKSGDSFAATVAQNTVGDDHASASYGRGGTVNGTLQPRYTWRVWAKDGSRYEFEEDLWWGWNRCADANEVNIETYKWLLSRVIDPNGNRITYNYRRNSWVGTTQTCDNRSGQATVDRDAWPQSITWGSNVNTTAIDRYAVEFVYAARTKDTAFDGADNQYGGTNGQPRETRQLTSIQVKSKRDTTWELVRQYNLDIDDGLYSDQSVGTAANTEFPKLRLKSITQVGKDGTTALPATKFTYGTDRGTGEHPNANWNRLIKVENGQGGVLEFQYERITASFFNNHRRVTSKITRDGLGNSYTSTYSYTNPALNSLGTTLDSTSTQQYPNSAVLYYNRFILPDNASDSRKYLATQALKEFRGHSLVTETDPNGGKTEHYFYQGDVGCKPQDSARGSDSAIDNDACFQQLREREFLKGREHKTVVRSATSGNPILQEIEHSFSVVFSASTDYSASKYKLAGLWRSWVYENQTVDRMKEGENTATSTKTTKYYYDAGHQAGGTQYGNLSKIEEFDQTNSQTPYRTTMRWYNTLKDDANNRYIVDRIRAELIRDGAGRWLALTNYFYDGRTTSEGVADKGNLTLVRKYYDVPLTASLDNVTLHSVDTSYTYDTYGNRITETTYADAGTRVANGSTVTWGNPGNGSTATTTTTQYDSTFNAFSTKVTYPRAGDVTLDERAGYDYRMGTLTSVKDPNGNETKAEYDVFGRMVKLIKPGDTSSVPTVQATYANYSSSSNPFRYTVSLREVSGQAGNRPISRFYDGLGQEIQTKQESKDGTENIVVDKKYDGLGNVKQVSQARSVTETSSTLLKYTVIPSSGMRWTTTTYDALNRPLLVTNPDNTKLEHHYGIADNLRYHDVVDANRHRTQWRYDSLGRLANVQEIAGDCANNYWTYTCSGSYTTAWSVYGTTTYTYDPLDQLKEVRDALGNSTTMNYDSLGRKTSMSDPDMGSWSYAYDVDGNLTRQTDAKSQQTTFAYDELNRLKSKTTPDGWVSSFTYDGATSNGKGQRTAMSRTASSVQQSATSFYYDTRGRKTEERHTVNGLTGTRSVLWAYDSGDRITSITYPSTNEVVSYTYDAAWRQTSVCSNQYSNVCYASGMQYTELNQPKEMTFGNSLRQSWSYSSPMQRISQIQVGTSAAPGRDFNRSYTYDNVGNVKTIANALTSETQNFQYDHRDRLTRAYSTGPDRYNTGQRGAYWNYNADTAAQLGTGDLTSVTRYAEGPCSGKAAGTCRFDTRTFVTIGSGPELESITAYGKYYNYNSSTGALLASGDLTSVSRYASGPCSGKSEGTCVFDTRTFVTLGNTQLESITANGKYYNYNASTGAFVSSGDLTSVTRYAEGPCSGKSEGTCVFDTRTFVTMNNILLESITAYGKYYNYNVSTSTLVNSGDLTSVSRYADGPCKNVASPCVFDTRTFVTMNNTLIESITEGNTYRTPIPYADESYSYDTIGNMTSKAGVSMSYGSNANGTGTGPHQARSVGGVSYTYDANGNLTTRTGTSITWNTDNQPTSITNGGVTETYQYDADGGRVKRVANNVTTVYLSGLYEEDQENGTKRLLYTLNGQVVAQRTKTETAEGVIYLHGDHLGSISVTTSSNGAKLSSQEFDPWGAIRSGSVSETSLNYTGQRRDGTGLLYYHARYYDPALGRFLSADSVVPGAPDGSMGGVALKPLTVDFHEPGFAARVNSENRQGFWFQNKDQNAPWGPRNAQALNRYSYVQNNPLRYNDPTGHEVYSHDEAYVLNEVLTYAINELLGALELARKEGNLALYVEKALSHISKYAAGLGAASIAAGLTAGISRLQQKALIRRLRWLSDIQIEVAGFLRWGRDREDSASLSIVFETHHYCHDGLGGCIVDEANLHITYGDRHTVIPTVLKEYNDYVGMFGDCGKCTEDQPSKGNKGPLSHFFSYLQMMP